MLGNLYDTEWCLAQAAGSKPNIIVIMEDDRMRLFADPVVSPAKA
jgi:hypothetical protein